jgi:hypothetical protein
MTTEKSFSLAGRKLMIAIPCYDGKVNIGTAFALASVGRHLEHFGARLSFAEVTGCSIVSRARNILVKQFLDSDCTDMLFVDADVVINTDAVLRLMAVSTGKDVVAGTYPSRTTSKKIFSGLYLDENKMPVMDENGLLKARMAATGFMLIRRHVITTLVERHPEWAYGADAMQPGRVEHALFDVGVVDNAYIGEDIMFCQRAIAEGFTVYIDPEISLPHIGSHAFERDFSKELLQPLMAAQKMKDQQNAFVEQEAA